MKRKDKPDFLYLDPVVFWGILFVIDLAGLTFLIFNFLQSDFRIEDHIGEMLFKSVFVIAVGFFTVLGFLDPATKIWIRNHQIEIRQIWLWRSVGSIYPFSEIEEQLVEIKGEDGDVYYKCGFRTSDGKTIPFGQFKSRGLAEKCLERFKELKSLRSQS